ncbi:MAG TPA: C-type lectin domain-containing protein, partial [Polyangiaceae bacterium]|nr:C-type lectin domain-containing protein [Polyangiaceae bacterium]
RAGEPGGAGGIGGASGAGAGGVAGAGGSAGGGPPACDASKGEFTLPSGAGACFFFLAKNAPPGAELGREKWQWTEARDDCARLGGVLASLSRPEEFEDVRDAIGVGAPITGVTVSKDVWVGGSTALTQASSLDQLAASFAWQSGEAWAYVEAGEGPWAIGQPDVASGGNVAEQCVEMRSGLLYRFNNRPCFNQLEFALCERPGPPDEDD